MDEIAVPGWKIVLDGRGDSDRVVLRHLKIPCVEIGGDGHCEMDGVVAAWFDRYNCKAAIVRPDHYVFCAVSEFRLLNEICRALQNKTGFATCGEA